MFASISFIGDSHTTPEQKMTTDFTPAPLPIAIGVSTGVVFVLVILFVIALFLVWHYKNKQTEIAKQASRSATHNGHEDIQMGDNTAYTNRPQDGQGQLDLTNNGLRLQGGQGHYELSENGAYTDRRHSELSDNEAYEQMDGRGRINEPYYTSIPNNGTQDK